MRRAPLGPPVVALLLASAAFTVGAVTLPAQAESRAGARPAAAAEAPRLRVETTTPRTIFYAGERVPIRVRISYDAAYFAESALPLLRRRTDVPILINAPFFATPPVGWSNAAEAPTTSGVRTVSLALGDDIATAVRRPDVVVADRPWSVLEIERLFRAGTPGETTLPSATARYAFATSFTEDFLGTRTPMDRRETEVAGEPILLRVLPPPTFGRPPEFGGAVGRFTMQATLDRTEGFVGESIRLALIIEGAGGDASFPIPRLDGMPGLPVLARTVRSEGTALIATYELALDDANVVAVPPASLAFFDPEASPPAYRVVRTTAVPIVVRPRKSTPGPGSRTAAAAPIDVADAMADILPTGTGAPRDVPRPIAAGTVVTALALPWLFAAAAFVARRLRMRATADGGGRAARRAAAVLARAMAKRGDPADAFACYLAARLRTDVPAVIAPDLRERLVSAGIARESAARAARLLEALYAARYGGATTADAKSTITALTATLETEFRGVEGSR